MAVSLVSTGVTFPDSSTQTTAATGFGFRNRIINGAMVIDQRNAGAAVTASGAFPVDRFSIGNNTDGAFSAQQDSSAPTGFVNSLKFTTTTADGTIAASQDISLQQKIEGTNIADLNWGATAASAGQTASPVTLSFWVKSSLTGTFSGAIANSAYNRSYPFTYTISAANTWEYKTITIPGDTSGTWLTTTGTGLRIYWNLGSGTDNTGTAGAWVGAGNVGADSTVAVIGTLSATWFITGVQLEKGSTATSFDYRPYGTELQLAQRYYEIAVTATEYIGCGFWNSATSPIIFSNFKVTKRATPTIAYVGTIGNITVYWSGSSTPLSSMTFLTGVGNTFVLQPISSGGTTGQAVGMSIGTGNQITVSAEL